MPAYCRCYVTQAFTGQLDRVCRSAVCRAIKRVKAHAAPLFAVRRKPRVSRKDAEALIVNCTEQPIQRPGSDAVQKAHDSGKKKRHTLKAEFVVTAAGCIASVSPSRPGSRHDLALRREGPPLPSRARVYADSAYQGYDKDHSNLDIPYKRPKGGELDEEETQHNRGLGSFRVAVGHRIGHVERFRIASDRFRNPRPTHRTKLSIIAGLVNMEAGFMSFRSRPRTGKPRHTPQQTILPDRPTTFATGLFDGFCVTQVAKDHFNHYRSLRSGCRRN